MIYISTLCATERVFQRLLNLDISIIGKDEQWRNELKNLRQVTKKLPSHIILKPRVIITHIHIIMPPGHSGCGLRSHPKLVPQFKASPQKLDGNQDVTEHLRVTHRHTSASFSLKPCLAEVKLFIQSGWRKGYSAIQQSSPKKKGEVLKWLRERDGVGMKARG